MKNFKKYERKKLGLFYRLFKRVIDIIGGLFGLIFFAPIIAFAIIKIKNDSPGPAIFKQQRLGLGGKPFIIYKLRGMYIDAKEKFPHLYDYSEKKDLDFYFHEENDPRVTKVGKFIRKTSIDELPNFFNVLIGNMSLVGPRPEIPQVIDLYGENMDKYLSVKPGITCNSKASLRDYLTKEKTLKMDLDYIDNMCLSKDIQLLYKTVKSIFFNNNVNT